MNNLFCEKCTLQFDKKYVFDLHLSLVHGEKIEIKNEPQISKENFQVHQRNQEDICETNFARKHHLKRNVA